MLESCVTSCPAAAFRQFVVPIVTFMTCWAVCRGWCALQRGIIFITKQLSQHREGLSRRVPYKVNNVLQLPQVRPPWLPATLLTVGATPHVVYSCSNFRCHLHPPSAAPTAVPDVHAQIQHVRNMDPHHLRIYASAIATSTFRIAPLPQISYSWGIPGAEAALLEWHCHILHAATLSPVYVGVRLC